MKTPRLAARGFLFAVAVERGKLIPCEGEVRRVRPGTFAGEVVIHPAFYDEVTSAELEDWYGPPAAEGALPG